MSAVEIVRLLDMIMGIAIRAGISITRYKEMIDENGGGPLTDEQIAELAGEAHDAVDSI